MLFYLRIIFKVVVIGESKHDMVTLLIFKVVVIGESKHDMVTYSDTVISTTSKEPSGMKIR